MNTAVFILLTLFTTAAWILIGYLVWHQIRSRQEDKYPEILGLVTSIIETDEGVVVTGWLNKEGKAIANEGNIQGLSLGMTQSTHLSIVDGTLAPGNDHVDGLALAAKPVHGANIDFVSTQPDPGQYVERDTQGDLELHDLVYPGKCEHGYYGGCPEQGCSGGEASKKQFETEDPDRRR